MREKVKNVVKVCVITMQYGFAGCLSLPNGFVNVCQYHNRSSQFNLDQSLRYSDQISNALDRMEIDACMHHDSESQFAKSMGHILSHSVTVIDLE